MLDMTSNVGSESLFISKLLGLETTACELDPETYKSLVKNTKGRTKITTMNVDSMTLLDNYYDVILCDPPWGGEDYM